MIDTKIPHPKFVVGTAHPTSDCECDGKKRAGSKCRHILPFVSGQHLKRRVGSAHRTHAALEAVIRVSVIDGLPYPASGGAIVPLQTLLLSLKIARVLLEMPIPYFGTPTTALMLPILWLVIPIL